MVIFFVLIGGSMLVSAIATPSDKPTWHRFLEGRALLFTVLTVVAVLVGGVVQIVPSVLVKPDPKTIGETRLASALEIEGRDVYIREGCYTCHSQMIRTMDFEAKRYGDASTMAESRYDHPFQWGSKRTGPDLAREGGKNPNAWHYRHFMDPPQLVQGSLMPSYGHFATNKIDFAGTESKLRGLRSVGVPFSVEQVQKAGEHARAQAVEIVADLAKQGITVEPDTEMVAIIAYMQSLGLPPAPPGAGAPKADLTTASAFAH
jgi:cytochrome c oxidase cbb3-type subunit I/II